MIVFACVDGCQVDFDHMYIADAFCDDVLNVEACNYDGGDCCLPEIDTTYCDLCVCNQS